MIKRAASLEGWLNSGLVLALNKHTLKGVLYTPVTDLPFMSLPYTGQGYYTALYWQHIHSI